MCIAVVRELHQTRYYLNARFLVTYYYFDTTEEKVMGLYIFANRYDTFTKEKTIFSFGKTVFKT